MRKWGAILFALALAGFGIYLVITAPKHADEQAIAAITPDIARGEFVFIAAGCQSCHTEKDAKGDARLKLGGGQRFPSPFGTFVAPNISPDKDHGIGNWTQTEFVSAVMLGTAPDGRHYFPAFPYAAYNKMRPSDAVSLWAYMQTLPPVTRPDVPHKVAFPFNIRRNLGGWKFLFMDENWVLTGDLSDEEQYGRYLVEALGHCAECHTPRNALGGLDRSRWMAGAPDPSGRGKIPNITPAVLTWSARDIAEYLKSGFTPDFDTAGSHMVRVIENTSRLSPSDRQAIVAYLKRLPAIK